MTQGRLVNVLLTRYGNGIIEVPLVIFNTTTGRPAFTGPAGEAGYGTTQPGATQWTMPDGRAAWYFPGLNIDPGNVQGLANYNTAIGFGRIEGFLSIGNIVDPVQATSIARAVLRDRQLPLVTATVGLEPTGAGDNPYVDFTVGDYVTCPDEDGVNQLLRVEALTISEDDDGVITFVPEVGTLAQDADRRFQAWLSLMSNGTLAGTVASASAPPAPPPPPNPQQDDLIDFHVAGALASWTQKADDTPFVRDGTLYKLTLTADTAPAAQDVIIHILFNGSPLLAPNGQPFTPTLHPGQNDRVTNLSQIVRGTRDPNTDVTPDKISIVPVQTDATAAGLHAIFSIKHA